jgi:hypothetical protein
MKRFRSRQKHTFADEILSAVRKDFGGHIEAKNPKGTRSCRRHLAQPPAHAVL